MSITLNKINLIVNAFAYTFKIISETNQEKSKIVRYIKAEIISDP
jgi:hypothetical protein